MMTPYAFHIGFGFMFYCSKHLKIVIKFFYVHEIKCNQSPSKTQLCSIKQLTFSNAFSQSQ